jgi:gamma-glutamyltranspeptidase/glutathione hydrolase
MTAEAGADMLRAGGTAFDAVIASLAMACVCEPVLCSPGGGGFAMIRDGATGVTSLIDFFTQTPLESRQQADVGVHEVSADFGTAIQTFHIGPATSATPGFMAGLERLHAAGATMPLAELFAPAIRAARDGVAVTAFQHYLSTVVRPILTASEAAANLFAPSGDVLTPGELFRNSGLADALEILAHEDFVGSPVADACIAAQAEKGHVTAADLAAYTTIERVPVAVRLGDSTVHLNPLPAASGTLIAHTLRHLESPDPVDMARALLATGQARRASNGDLSALDAATLRQRGTTHVSVVDANGTACSVSVSNGEGNGEIVDGFGFMLNNILGEEDVNAAGADGWPLDTRLASMMCPTLIESPDGDLVALGSGGSNRIRSAICQVIVGLCLRGDDVGDAITSPRLHIEGDHLDFEDRFDRRVRDEISALFPDHTVWPEPNMFFGGVHTVRRRADGRLVGVGDTRRDGTAIVVEA